MRRLLVDFFFSDLFVRILISRHFFWSYTFSFFFFFLALSNFLSTKFNCTVTLEKKILSFSLITRSYGHKLYPSFFLQAVDNKYLLTPYWLLLKSHNLKIKNKAYAKKKKKKMKAPIHKSIFSFFYIRVFHIFCVHATVWLRSNNTASVLARNYTFLIGSIWSKSVLADFLVLRWRWEPA